MRRAAVFLDKDGTLIEDVPYNVDCAQIRLAADAGDALARLQSLGYALVVVTNQSGVALDYFPPEALDAVCETIADALERQGVSLTGFYYCPHALEGSVPQYAIACDCRKPRPGMLVRAAQELDLDLRRSWMIGDILNDVEAGHRAGCRSILIDNGGETQWDMRSPLRRPDFIAGSLTAATDHIERMLMLDANSHDSGAICHAGPA